MRFSSAFPFPAAVCAAFALAGCAGEAVSGKVAGFVGSSTLDTTGEVRADAPVLTVRGQALRYALHEVSLPAGRLTRVRVTAVDPRSFDPLMECRAKDAAPNEVVRCEDFSELGNGVQLDLLPSRPGPWLIYVGDEQGRPGAYRIEVFPVAERRIYTATGRVSEALTGTEKPVTLFCQVQSGRRYRATVSAAGFPPYFLVGAPGAAPIRAPQSGEVTFTAARSGQVVLQVSSLSLASGDFSVDVVELW